MFNLGLPSLVNSLFNISHLRFVNSKYFPSFSVLQILIKDAEFPLDFESLIYFSNSFTVDSNTLSDILIFICKSSNSGYTPFLKILEITFAL